MRTKVSISTGELLTGVTRNHWTTNYLMELLHFENGTKMLVCLKGSMAGKNFVQLKKALKNNDKVAEKFTATSAKTTAINSEAETTFEEETTSETEVEVLRKREESLMERATSLEKEVITLTEDIATVDESLLAIDNELDGYFKDIAKLKSEALKLIERREELTTERAEKISAGEIIESEIFEIDDLIRELTIINISVDVKNLTYYSDKECVNAHVTIEEIMEKINLYPILRTLTFNTIEFLLQLKKIECEESPLKVVFDFGEETEIRDIFNSIS